MVKRMERKLSIFKKIHVMILVWKELMLTLLLLWKRQNNFSNL